MHIDGTVARSPFRAPFGSLEFSTHITPMLLYDFLVFIEITLLRKGVTDVFLKNPPHDYAPERLSLLETFLLNESYRIFSAEVTSIIPVSEKIFSQVIRHSENLRLHQAQNASFNFAQLPPGQLEDVYRFLAGCHREKGYNLSITEEDLKSTAMEFPDRYLLFAVFLQGKIVAASISIRINEKILYNFLANHERQYNALSPMVLLLEGVYKFCRDNHISLMDLGTSASREKPNFKLLDFKMHMGGVPSSKFTFHKKIS